MVNRHRWFFQCSLRLNRKPTLRSQFYELQVFLGILDTQEVRPPKFPKTVVLPPRVPNFRVTKKNV